ncbi:MAG: hypothetical protein U1F43_38720 [Myxococcota bacterium]
MNGRIRPGPRDALELDRSRLGQLAPACMRRLATTLIAIALVAAAGLNDGGWSIWCSMAHATVATCCCDDGDEGPTGPAMEIACCQTRHHDIDQASGEVAERAPAVHAPAVLDVTRPSLPAPRAPTVERTSSVVAVSLPPPAPSRSLLATWNR